MLIKLIGSGNLFPSSFTFASDIPKNNSPLEFFTDLELGNSIERHLITQK